MKNPTLLGIAAAVVLVSSSYAADIFVPGDFGTIQAAIDDPGTVAGDVVIVAQGEYFENINFNRKATPAPVTPKPYAPLGCLTAWP